MGRWLSALDPLRQVLSHDPPEMGPAAHEARHEHDTTLVACSGLTATRVRLPMLRKISASEVRVAHPDTVGDADCCNHQPYEGCQQNPMSSRSHLINGQPSRLVNSDLHNFDSGAESAAALQPRATPWVSESIGAPCKGGGILRPCRAQQVLGHVPGALPRAGMLRAVGASWRT